MAIHLLDTHMAELIAAGEVVERPASIVKELAENAIDAGAATVTVEIERGGITQIRVMDDGTGIEASDIELAFLRHATSKVRSQEDLDAIQTLGFRGEALASIASVSRVELLTKSDADEYANRYTIEGGQAGEMTEDARPRGTTFVVRDLFYNTPARMKFLKKDSSEGVYVTEMVTRMALSHPEVAFRYVRDGKQVFTTPGNGDLRAAIYSVLGPDFARDLVPVGYLDLQSRVLGYVTPPRASRASRAMQFFFVNGRFVKNRTMMAALEQAYRGMIMQGKYPGGVLFLQMQPQLLDVNVHPAKTEVRFAREQDVFGTVYRAVKGALLESEEEHNRLAFPPAKESDAPAEEAQAIQEDEQPAPVETAGQPFQQNAQQIESYNEMVHGNARLAEELDSTAAVAYQLSSPLTPPASVAPAYEYGLDVARPGEEEEGASAQPSADAEENQGFQAFSDEASLIAQQQQMEEEDSLSLRLLGEVFKTYILAEFNDTLCLIDKHAAHERILYEEVAAARGTAAAQQLLTPVNVTLSAAEKNALLQNEEALKEVGIEVDDFGGNSVVVRGVPADLEVTDVEDLVVEVAQRLSINAKDNLDEKSEWVMHSIACRAAVKAGDRTTPMEMLALAKDILSGAVPPFCPHGRPVVLEITRKELEKQFGRLG
ncbi:DNA mismatch repair endonuclease MutL [Clostridia bacterium OttesenSCG-928-O13]|nr:DNA mismatch repair endonuclease MutL [Clostridia bacterium OttesenSCG-928-O13]